MDAAVTLIFPIYIVWIFLVYGMTAWDILGFITTIYLLLDAAGFLMALHICKRYDAKMVWTIAPYLLTSGIFRGMFMRLIRFYAYYEEWVHRASYNDAYSPSRVSRQALVMRD
jgi:hypothetical protein